jgi:hypothetical protein
MSRLAESENTGGAPVEGSSQLDHPEASGQAEQTAGLKPKTGDPAAEKSASSAKRPAKPAKAQARGASAGDSSAIAKPTKEKRPSDGTSASDLAGTPQPIPDPASAPDTSAARLPLADVSSERVTRPSAKRPAAKRATSKTTAKAAKPAAAKRKSSSPKRAAAKATPAGTSAPPEPVTSVAPEPVTSVAPEAPSWNGQPAEAARAEAAARQAYEATRLEFCQIGWWRGYVKSEFYADAIGPEGDRYRAGTSPEFRWWRSTPPERTKAAVAAHEALVAKLLRAGWEPEEQGFDWYEARFSRLRPRGLADRLARAGELGSPVH